MVAADWIAVNLRSRHLPLLAVFAACFLFLGAAPAAALTISSAPTTPGDVTITNGGTHVVIAEQVAGSNLDIDDLVPLLEGGATSATIEAATGADITASVPLDAPSATADLTLVSDGTVNLGAVDLPTDIDVQGSASVAGDIRTTGNQRFRDDVTLTSDVTFASSGSGSMEFQSDVLTSGGIHDLTVDSSGATSFGGSIGALGANLGYFTSTGGGTTTFLAPGKIWLVDDLDMQDAVLLHADYELLAFIATFGSTIDSDATPRSLSIETDDEAVLGGAIGATAALRELRLSGGAARFSAHVSVTQSLELGRTFIDASSTMSADVIDASGQVTVDSAAVWTLSPATSAATTTINGTGALVKAGAGTWTIDSAMGATPGLTVQAGRLQLAAGASFVAPVTQTGGIVSGRAPFGDGLISTGGELDAVPGDPIAGDVLQFTTLDLAPTSVVRARVGAPVNLYAAGVAQLDDATLVIEAAGALPNVGTTHVVLDLTGAAPATGTFAGLAEGATTFAAGALWRISYAGGLDGNDVVLTRIARATTTTLTLGSTVSQAGAPVALTAMTSVLAGAPPTGAVTFLDGGVVIGTVPLTGGSATLMTSSLAVGTHALTARFGAVGDLAASTSTVAMHEVTSAPVADPPVTPTPPVTPPPPATPQPPVPPVSLVYANGSCMRASRSDLRVSFRLAQAARVTYTIQRRLRPPSSRLTKCPTRMAIGTGGGTSVHRRLAALVRSERAGRRSVTVQQLIGNRRLAPGVHRILIDVRDARGRKLQTITRSFVVLAR